VVIFGGMATAVIPVQKEKALFPILVSFSGSVTAVSAKQYSKAFSPIFFTHRE